MKTLPIIISAAAIAAVFYLGYSINHAAHAAQATTAALTQQLDRALAESAKWHTEADRANQIIDSLPATARASAEQAVKGGTRQGEKALVGAPTEIAKDVAKNTENTSEKAYKDTVKFFKKPFGK